MNNKLSRCKIFAIHLARLIVASTSLVGSSANAALIDLGSYVLDTTSNLEWYKPNNTRSLTLNQVTSELDSTFAGWTFASYSQVEGLFASAGLPSFTSDLSFIPQITTITSIFGNSFDGFNPNFFGVSGYTISPDCSNCIATPHIFMSRDSLSSQFQYVFIETPGFIDTNGYTVVGAQGAFLVRPAVPVPEPETYAMLLAGLGLLSFTAKRKKQSA